MLSGNLWKINTGFLCFLPTLKLSCLCMWTHLLLLVQKNLPTPKSVKLGKSLRAWPLQALPFTRWLVPQGLWRLLLPALGHLPIEVTRGTACPHSSDCLVPGEFECLRAAVKKPVLKWRQNMLTLLCGIFFFFSCFWDREQGQYLRGFSHIPLYRHLCGCCETCLPPSGCSWSLYTLFSIHLLPLHPTQPDLVGKFAKQSAQEL